MQEADVNGVLLDLLLDLLEARQRLEAAEDGLEGLGVIGFGGQDDGVVLAGQANFRVPGDRVFANGEGNGDQQLIQENDVGRVLSFPPDVGVGGTPAGRDLDRFLPRFNGLQAGDVALELAALVEELGEEFQVPVGVGLEVFKTQFDVDVAGFVVAELGQVDAVGLQHVVVGAFVKADALDVQVALFVLQFEPVQVGVVEVVFARLDDVEILAADLLPVDVGLPVVGAFFPEGPALLVAPALAQVDDVVELADLLVNRQVADLGAGLVLDVVAAQVHLQGPVLQVEFLVVEAQFRVDVGRLEAVEDLAVLLHVFPEVFGGIVHLQFLELEALLRQIFVLCGLHSQGKVMVIEG